MSRTSSKRHAIGRSSWILSWNNSLYLTYFPTIRFYNRTHTHLLLCLPKPSLTLRFPDKILYIFPITTTYNNSSLISFPVPTMKRTNGDSLQEVLVSTFLFTIPSHTQIFSSAHCSHTRTHTHTHTHKICAENSSPVESKVTLNNKQLTPFPRSVVTPSSGSSSGRTWRRYDTSKLR